VQALFQWQMTEEISGVIVDQPAIFVYSMQVSMADMFP
jgi:hypothetical protein